MHALSSTSYSSAGAAAPKCASQRASTRPSTSARATAAPQDASLSQSGVTPSKARVAILGASGYTGADCVRLCHAHPFIDIVELTGESQAGKAFDEVYPHLAATNIPTLKKVGDVDFGDVDAAFCCLPHATTQDILASLPKHVKVVDLSADFRLKDINTYAQWYGGEHKAPELQKEAVYGLTEVFREEIKAARLVANPGCYPTSVQLPLIPLLKAGLISPDDIIIDAKSGVSGAGRSTKQANLYTEVAEGMKAYGVGSHRHMPEIEQGLSEAAGRELKVSFTPHLIPMSRGMMSTMYVRLAEGQTADSLRDHLTQVYAEEPFVQVMAAGKVPDTHYVRGTNFNFVNVFQDRRPGWAVVVSAIDNLVKGASGQALQNLNLVLGFPEGTGLNQLALFP